MTRGRERLHKALHLTLGTAASHLGVGLGRVRLAKALSQEQVAFAADISVQTYGSLERGMTQGGRYTNPTLQTLLLVFQALDIPVPPFPQA